MIRFTLADMERASDEWNASCGPAALAAICGLTLEEVRPHFPGFPGFTNPTMMIAAIKSARPAARFEVSTYRDHGWPRYGLARIQWEGPWCAPGVNPRAAYRYTHWVGVQEATRSPRDVLIWDVNALDGGCDGWLFRLAWERQIVPVLTADIKRASGAWHITHAIEIARP